MIIRVYLPVLSNNSNKTKVNKMSDLLYRMLIKNIQEDFVKADVELSEEQELKEPSFETYARFFGREVKDLKFMCKENFGMESGYIRNFDHFEDHVSGYIELGKWKEVQWEYGNLCYESLNIYETKEGRKLINIRDKGYSGWITS